MWQDRTPWHSFFCTIRPLLSFRPRPPRIGINSGVETLQAHWWVFQSLVCVCSGACSDVCSVVFSGALSGACSSAYSVVFSGALSGACSDVFSGVCSGAYLVVFSGALSGACSDVFSGACSGAYSVVFSDACSVVFSGAPSGACSRGCLGSGSWYWDEAAPSL